MWKDVVLAKFKVLPRNLCAVTEENQGKSVKVTGDRTEI
jgi:hypothetical protein